MPHTSSHKNQSLAAAQDNRTDFNLISKSFDQNIQEHHPSDVINFSNMSHELVWRTQKGEYDNIMKNSYFSLSNEAIKRSREENEYVTPRDILRDMKNIAGDRNVPHFLNYPSDEAEGTISNQMIKERNFQKYMENPAHVRDMIADAFLLKIANDGSISEMDREELIKEAENGKDSAELHDMIARMTYNNPKAYKAFHKILLESERLHREINSGDEYGFVSDVYEEHYSDMARSILEHKESYKDAEYRRREDILYVLSDGVESRVSDAITGRDIESISQTLQVFEKADVVLNQKLQQINHDNDNVVTGLKEISFSSLAQVQDKLEEIEKQSRTTNQKLSDEIEELFNEVRELENVSMSFESTKKELEKVQHKIETVYDFSSQHEINQSTSNEIMYEMHQAGRYDQNPYLFLDIPKVGDEKEDGTLFTKEEVNKEIEYNATLISSAVNSVLGDEVQDETKSTIAKNIIHDLYSQGDERGHNKGAYYDAVKEFVKKSQNDPMTMTVYSSLNSVATTIVRDAIYNELMATSFEEKENEIYQELKSTGLDSDKGKTVHIAEKLKQGSYLETLEKQEGLKDDVAALMNKATLFSKVANGEINAEQTEAIIDETAIFRDLDSDEKEAIKDVTNDIFDAKNEIDMSKYYSVDRESRNRFLDDIVTDNVFGYIENSDNGMMPGISKMFRNNRALENFVRCGQSGSIKDRNAESVANNLKSCMESYREEVEKGRERSEDVAVRTMSTPFGAMNGMLVFLVMLQQAFMDNEYRKTKRALGQMHQDILNKLAFRRASPDLQTEKARAAILSADANKGVTNTTIAHAVADKYVDTLQQEKIASTIFEASMRGVNLFNEDNIYVPDTIDKQGDQIDLQVDINKLVKERDRLEAQVQLLQRDANVINKASMLDPVELEKIAEETYEQFNEVSKALSVAVDEVDKNKLLRQKNELSESLEILQEQHKIVEAALEMKAKGVDPLENLASVKQTLSEIDKEFEAKTREMELYDKPKKEIAYIGQDDLQTLVAKSEYLRKIGEKIASQSVERLTPADRKKLEDIVSSREILAVAMIKASGYSDSIQMMGEAFDEQFQVGRSSTGNGLSRSGIDKAIESLNLKSFDGDILRIIKNSDVAYDKVKYKELLNKIEQSSGLKLEKLQKTQDEVLQGSYKSLLREISVLQERQSGGEDVNRQLEARKKDLEKIKDYTQTIIFERELKSVNEAMKIKTDSLMSRLLKATPESAVEILNKEKLELLKESKSGHAKTIQSVKETLRNMNMDFEFTDDSREQKVLNQKSDLVHEAKATGMIEKIEKASRTVENIADLKNARTGNTQSSIMLSNKVNDILKTTSKENKTNIFHAAGIKIREFVNKTNDNMSSMLLFTDSRSIFLESVREDKMNKGQVLDASEIDKQLKEYVANEMSYDIEGVESLSSNANDSAELRESGVSVQEGQRQTRAAMLK